MIIDARRGDRGVLVDEAAGQKIHRARWANLETGEFEAWTDDQRLYRGRTQLRWIPAQRKTTPTGLALPVGSGVKVDTNRPCEHYACTRPAEWLVSDEEPLAPEVVEGRSYERAQLIGVRYYCSWHYQPPRLLLGREVVTEFDVKARPQ